MIKYIVLVRRGNKGPELQVFHEDQKEDALASYSKIYVTGQECYFCTVDNITEEVMEESLVYDMLVERSGTRALEEPWERKDPLSSFVYLKTQLMVAAKSGVSILRLLVEDIQNMFILIDEQRRENKALKEELASLRARLESGEPKVGFGFGDEGPPGPGLD